MARCCADCAKITIEETAQAKLAKAFQAKLNKVGTMYRGNDIMMACPVTGGIKIPVSGAILHRVFTGAMTLTCFEEKTDENI
jgi:hypothetical protein